jgi:hypothetical protein
MLKSGFLIVPLTKVLVFWQNPNEYYRSRIIFFWFYLTISYCYLEKYLSNEDKKKLPW